MSREVKVRTIRELHAAKEALYARMIAAVEALDDWQLLRFATEPGVLNPDGDDPRSGLLEIGHGVAIADSHNLKGACRSPKTVMHRLRPLQEVWRSFGVNISCHRGPCCGGRTLYVEFELVEEPEKKPASAPRTFGVKDVPAVLAKNIRHFGQPAF